jgi:nitroreductase/NAD-dependent dihydropyrimidine dehydrogenase PreA subunit
MALFSIDHDKCKRDRLCVNECPMTIIKMVDDDSFPEPVSRAQELCIGCGHCVTVCPHGAFTHELMTPDQCAPVDRSLKISPEQAEQLFKARRSIRRYKKEPVEKELIEKLLDIGRYGPSGHNEQPAEFLVVYDRATLQEWAEDVVNWCRFMVKEKPRFSAALHLGGIVALWEQGVDKATHGAPHAIMAHGPAASRRTTPACTIAIAHIELAATVHGLGACWAGYLNYVANSYPPLIEKLGIPEGHEVIGTLLIGRPAVKYGRIPMRKPLRVQWK